MDKTVFKEGDVVYFREEVKGDTDDKKTGLYIPDFFEEMVGNYYVVHHIQSNGRLVLSDDFFNHRKTFSDCNFHSCVFEPYWFDICNEKEIVDDDITDVSIFCK